MTHPALPRCVLCDAPCIPMADFDTAVCIGCDTALDEIRLRAAFTAALEQKTTGAERLIAKLRVDLAEARAAALAAEPPRVTPQPDPLLNQFGRPIDSFYGPAPRHVIDELVDAITPRRTLAYRRRKALAS